MIFEYLPTNITQDIDRLRLVCDVLPITKILIPSNPVSKPYPDSLSITATLRDMMCRATHLQHIHFIPTIKTSIYTKESLYSAFLSLEYLHISHIAIISGDTIQSHTLKTCDALKILNDMQKDSQFLRKLNIFCALESNISVRNSSGLCKKIQHGVKNFITQPFYLVNSKHKTQQTHNSTPYFLPQKIHNFEAFLSFYKNLIKIYTNNTLSLTPLSDSIQIYCGFLPLSLVKQAHAIHAKKLGISIPNWYIKAIDKNAKLANIELFNALQGYNISLSYLQFSDITMLLSCINSNSF